MRSPTSPVLHRAGRSRRLAVLLAAGAATGGLLLSPGVAAAGPPGVDCTSSVSSPVRTAGGVSATVTQTCPYVVPQIQVGVGISVDQGNATSTGNTRYNVSSNVATVTVPCRTGDYRSSGSTFVLYPRGHRPQMYSEAYPSGPVVRIVC